MHDQLQDRIILEARYIIETGATVRATAKEFHLGKSTVHKDVTERLKTINNNLYKEVRKVLLKNLAERHIRGGIATKLKYAEIKGR
jgi:putative DeoR family transcriptional regulator (stage III sporulation protein D)